jgi:hypothetical protein
MQVFQRVGQAMYEQQQQAQAAPGPDADAPGAAESESDDDVVEGEIVDEDGA